MLATVEDSPGDAAGVLALEEQGLGLSAVEAEDLAVATDIDFTLESEETMLAIHPSDMNTLRREAPSS